MHQGGQAGRRPYSCVCPFGGAFCDDQETLGFVLSQHSGACLGKRRVAAMRMTKTNCLSPADALPAQGEHLRRVR